MLETKKKNLIACSVCESQGKKSILGEIGTAGEFIVQRFHQGETIIKAPIMAAICGLCGGTAYVRNERGISTEGDRVYFQSVEVSFTGTYPVFG